MISSYKFIGWNFMRTKIVLILFIIFSFGYPFQLSSSLPSYKAQGMPMGFFSNFALVVGVLEEYENNKLRGLTVDLLGNGCYTDTSVGSNWWTQYFEPIHLGDCSEATHMTCPKMVERIQYVQWRLPKMMCHEFIKKYIRIKQPILDEVQKFAVVNEFDKFNIIGVHYRGTDKISAAYREAQPISYQDLYNYMLKAKSGMANVKFFIASDDERFIEFLNQRCPHDFCQYTQPRCRTELGLHNMSEIPAYDRGKNALIDCLLLAKSKTLIRMSSHLSNTSVMFNPKMKVINANYPAKGMYKP